MNTTGMTLDDEALDVSSAPALTPVAQAPIVAAPFGATPIASPAGTAAETPVPSRRRQREAQRVVEARDRVPALAALDSADDYVLVVREGGRLRIFSEGRLVLRDEDGTTITEGGALPLQVTEAEVQPLPASVEDTASPASHSAQAALEAAAGTAEALPATVEQAPFESVLFGASPKGAEEDPTGESSAAASDQDALNQDALDEDTFDEDSFDEDEDADRTDRVTGIERGSSAPAGPERVAPEGPFLSVGLVLPDGRRVAVAGTVIVGRSPSVAGYEAESPELIALPATLTDISRNHLEIRSDGDALLARDLGSTNGTILSRPGNPPQLVPTDTPVLVVPGDALSLGGSATLEIEGLR